MNRRLPSLTVSILLILVLFAGLDLSFDIIPNVSSGFIEVDDSGSKDYLTIQEGVDAAQPGDTVFVYAGVYYEDVYINKTINLTGISRDNTTINATDTGIFAENADYINISGFTVENGSSAGIRLKNLNNTNIKQSKIQHSIYGLKLINADNGYILDNYYFNINDYTAIYLDGSSENLIENNTVIGSNTGIWLSSSSNNNKILNNNCSNNEYGLSITTASKNNIIKNNIFNYNNGIFNYHDGISIGSSSDTNTFINNTLESNKYGIIANNVKENIFINSTIKNSEEFDILIRSNTELFLLNSTHNKSSVKFTALTSTLTVQWYIHLKIIDYFGIPVSNAKVRIEDNENGTYNETFITDSNGNLRWLPLTEYIEKDTDGDEVGEKTYFTSHKIVAWNDTLVGYAQPLMNESKTVTIVLYNGTLMDLEPGWNLISLPRIQPDTNLPTVLLSIEGQYDAIQWYNITDTKDPWKHYHISKPSFMNDLWKLNQTMGFWLYITDPQGTILVLFGDKLIFDQNISLYPGWNLVGFPSKTNKTRDIALGTLNFGSDIDSIWTFNTTIQKWIELDQSMDYFEVGQGYWVHSKVTDIWNVPL